MRTLLAAGGNRPYIVNPTSPSAFELREAQLDFLRRCVADAHHDAEHPSLHNPWVFQLPDDALYPVAVKLVEWFNSHDRVDEAFLYELTRGGQSQIVLGLNEEVDQALADTLIDVAVRAGVSAASFVVRFLPDEPSHREGVALGGITPFYRRPASSLN